MADSCGLLQKLFSSLFSKISVSSDTSSPSSSSSTEASVFWCSSWIKSMEAMKPSLSKEWWFQDLLVFAPNMIEKMVKELGVYGIENKSLLATRFLLYYLNYRGLFWVLRLVSRLGLSRECRVKLERLMGSMLDKAELDDLLVSGHDEGVYDVKLVMKLVRFFLKEEDGSSLMRLKKVGRLMDKYLKEISPDQRLKAGKFLGVAESLPDSARDCYDGVYRALEIFIQSHPNLSFEECKRLCRCLNYEKLTLGTCKDLARNPRIPPDETVQALASQQPKLQAETNSNRMNDLKNNNSKAVLYTSEANCESSSPYYLEEKRVLRFNLQQIHSRIMSFKFF